SCSTFRKLSSVMGNSSGSKAFRKSMSRGLLASSPKSFLKPKSVNGLRYRAFMPQLYHLLSFVPGLLPPHRSSHFGSRQRSLLSDDSLSSVRDQGIDVDNLRTGHAVAMRQVDQ